MDVRCEKCGTEYELDESKLKASGVTVKCTSCGHMFKVRRKSAKAGAGAKGGELRTWLVKMEDGEIRACYELATLRDWIAAGEVSPACTISRTGKKWKRLGEIAELAAFFQSGDSNSGVPTPVKRQPTHPRTIRRDGASKTARLPKPTTGSHGVPAAKRTLIGAPGIIPPAKASVGADDETRPLSDAEREQVQEAMAQQGGWYSAPTEDEKTLEVERAAPADTRATDNLKTDKIPHRFDSEEDEEEEFTEELEAPDLGAPGDVTHDLEVTQDLATGDMEPAIRASSPGPEPVPEPEEPDEVEEEDAPTEVKDEERKTGAWASAGKLGRSLEEAEGTSGPVGGLRVSSAGDSFAGRVRPLDEHEHDEHLPRRSGGLGKWVVIVSLALMGAAGSALFFVFGQQEGGQQRASADAAVPIVAAMDASAVAIDAAKAASAPWQAAVDGANAALGLDVRAGLEGAAKELAEVADAPAEVLLVRAQLEAALAQLDIDEATASGNTAQARKLQSASRSRATKAEELAKAAREAGPEDARILAVSADLARLQGKAPREVARWLRKAEAAAESDRYVKYVGAMELLRGGKKAEARAAFESLIDDSITDTRPRYRLAALDLQDASLESAKSAADAVLGMAPDHVGAKRLLEEIAAKSKVSQADPLPPQDTGSGKTPVRPTVETYDSLLAKANKVAETGNCPSAMNLYRQALDENPAGVEALTGLGYCHIDQKQFAQAQAKFRAALGVSPRYQNALFGVAEAYQQQGLKDKAIEAYRAYLSAHPNGMRAASAKRQIERLGGGASSDSGSGSGSGSGSTGGSTGAGSGSTESGSGTDNGSGAGSSGTSDGAGSTGTGGDTESKPEPTPEPPKPEEPPASEPAPSDG